MVKFTQKQLDKVYELSHALFIQLVEKGGRRDITSIGPGEKIVTKKKLFGGTKEVPTGELAIVFGVQEKLPKDKVTPSLLIPTCIDNIPTDVQEVGKVRILTLNSRIRPVRSGYSWGNPKITAGSPGTQVRYNGKVYVDTNWHVGLYKTGKIGDPIIQPGSYDGGSTTKDIVGHVRIANEDPSLGKGVWTDMSLVEMDVEKFNPTLSQSEAIPGKFKIVTESADKIFWEGRSSGLARGNISNQHQDVQVGDPEGQVWYFYDTDYFYPAPIGGDSGSAIWSDPGVELKGRTVDCVGKLFAGSDVMGVMIPARSQVKIYPGIEIEPTMQDGGSGGTPPKVEYVRLYVQLEGHSEVSFGNNPIPDAEGIYTWVDRTPTAKQIFVGAHTCHADVKLEGIEELIKGEVRRFVAVDGGSGDDDDDDELPTYTVHSIVTSPTEGEVVDCSKPVYFKVKVEIVENS